MHDVLSGDDVDIGLRELRRHSDKRIINALFPLLCSQDEIVRWRAVVCMGIFVSRLADEDMEAARNVMRRLMWNLNDESGGIGWGSPEVMGVALSRHKGLAREYASILLSYANRDGNFLELPMLQRGLLWGIARFAEADPETVKSSKPHFLEYLDSKDAAVRGHAALILGLIGTAEDGKYLLPLAKDKSPYMTYVGDRCVARLVGKTAEDAIRKLGTNASR